MAHYFLRKNNLIQFGIDDKIILTTAIPGALGSNTSNAVNWKMTVTWEDIILSNQDHTVICMCLKTLTEDVRTNFHNISLMQKKQANVFFLKHLLASLALIIIAVSCHYVQFSNGTHYYPMVHSNGLRVYKHMKIGDVICNTDDKCTTFPRWLYNNQNFHDNNIPKISLAMQSDGNLVIYYGTTHVLWSSNTEGTKCHSFIYNGNETFTLVCDDRDDILISNQEKKKSFDVFYGLSRGDQLNVGSKLCDDTNCVQLNDDGNLHGDKVPYFVQLNEKKTTGENYRLLFSIYGNLILYNNKNEVVWTSKTQDKGCVKVTKRGSMLTIWCEKITENIMMTIVE